MDVFLVKVVNRYIYKCYENLVVENDSQREVSKLNKHHYVFLCSEENIIIIYNTSV